MELDYDALSALTAVVREGRFDEAAKSLNVTQSAVSQRLKQLEEKVGTVLVVRGRPCVPTEAGLQLCRHVEQVSLLQHEVSSRMRALSGEESAEAATIRISANNDSLATWFPFVIRRAADELQVRFDLLPDDQEHTEQKLKSGDALAVVTSSEEAVQGCRRISLGCMNYLAVATPEVFERYFADGVTIDAIEAAPCLAFDRKDTIQEQWMMLAFGEARRPSTHFVPSYEGYLACCLNGTAWGLVPSIAIEKELETGKLIELTPGKSVRVSLHWQASTHSGEILRRLGDLVLDVAKQHLLPDSFRTE